MKLCMGCMNQIEDYLSVCPYCGFNESELRQESYYLSPGTILGGKYIVGRVMNYSGHTVSYLGYDAEPDRKVIIKEYLPSDFSTRSEGEKDITIYSGDAEAQFVQGLTNYLNEANQLEHLKHVDGIADVYNCILENETGYVIGEYVEGKTLKEMLDSGKRYSVQSTLSVIKKLLKGLSRVHPLNVIHCDIAPETIMVTQDGDVKLMDFGATRYVTTANSKSLAIILKQGYAPEEQYRSKGVRGPWTDVYAVAAVMYHMLTGQAPQESVERALLDELKEPSKLGVKLPVYIENALMNALNVYQEDRTPSAEAFLKELSNKETKRKKVKRAKKAPTKIPIWVKGMVAGLVLLISIGGIVIFRNLSQSTVVETVTCAVPDFTGETIEVAQNKADTWQKNGIDIKIEVVERRYSPDAINNGKIYSQDVTSGTDLLDVDQVIALENEELKYDENKHLTGTIRCGVYTNEVISYGELAGKNAYLISQYLKKDINGDLFKKVKDSDKEYWEVKNITVAGIGEIKPKALADEKQENTTIKVSDIQKITYYGSAFLKWNALPDFADEYHTVKELKKVKFKRYEYDNEKDTIVKDKKVLPDSMIQKNFYSFEYAPGTIVGQSMKAGDSYDTSVDGRLKIYAIKTQLGMKTPKGDNSGYAVRRWIMKETGLSVDQIEFSSNGGMADPNQQVLRYHMTKKGSVVRYFEKGDKGVRITLTVNDRPKTVYDYKSDEVSDTTKNKTKTSDKKSDENPLRGPY